MTAIDAIEEPTSPPSSGAQLVRLMTFNILAGGIGRSRREERFDPVMDVIRTAEPHAVALQECLYWEQDDYRLMHRAERATGMRAVIGLAPNGMHVAILVRAPLWIEETRVINGGVWRVGAIRALCGWEGGGENRMYLVSAHLSARRKERRILEVEDLAPHIEPEAERGAIVVVGTDTNTPDKHLDVSELTTPGLVSRWLGEDGRPDTRAVDLLEAAGFTDAAQVDGKVPERTTGHWPGHTVKDRPDRFMNSAAAARCALGPARIVPQAAAWADHLPLVQELALPLASPTPAHAANSDSTSASV
jgi:endonuclease/exonuclease/phosphatase family metal-dependent hydrolase